MLNDVTIFHQKFILILRDNISKKYSFLFLKDTRCSLLKLIFSCIERLASVGSLDGETKLFDLFNSIANLTESYAKTAPSCTKLLEALLYLLMGSDFSGFVWENRGCLELFI